VDKLHSRDEHAQTPHGAATKTGHPAKGSGMPRQQPRSSALVWFQGQNLAAWQIAPHSSLIQPPVEGALTEIKQGRVSSAHKEPPIGNLYGYPPMAVGRSDSMAKLAVKFLLASSSFRGNRRRTRWHITTVSTLVTIGVIALFVFWHSNLN
jgi:hypothetical protein